MENSPENPSHSLPKVPPNLPASDTAVGTVSEWLAARRTRMARSNRLPEQKTIPESVHSTTPNGRSVTVVETNAIFSSESAPVGSRESRALRLLRWPKRAEVFGISLSLALHLAMLMSLAVFVISGRTVAHPTSVPVEFGHFGGDTIIDPTLEASLEMDGGHEATPLRNDDPKQLTSFDALGVNFGEALDGVINGMGTGDGRGIGEGTGPGTGSGIGVPAINVPSFAVSKGSFSAWTEPRDPDPGQRYVIVIQVRLPKSLREYRGSDLTGMVIGTDQYKQAIKFRTNDKFPVKDGAVEIRISVPGAAKLVRDTIRIESRLLREKQTLKIEF